MMLPSSVIKEYLLAKFPVNKVFASEFTTNSIFTSDEKMHLSVNLETGLWQDFKSQEKGNFPQLVAAVEDIPYDQALKYLRTKLFDTPEHLFEISSLHVQNQKPTSENTVGDIVKSFVKFDPTNINPNNLTERLARKFILSRKLQKFNFYIAKSGRYANRIIIPYQDKRERIFYFQARNLSIMGMKYLNPSRQVTGVKSSEILYPFEKDADYVFITEGPIDAMSLQANGINATCTQGSHLSMTQAQELKDKQIIFAYDNDEAGKMGIAQARKALLKKNKNDFCICSLPEGIKDWNELHMACESSDQFIYQVKQGLKVVDFEYDITEALS
jgi:hypothetical protein